MAFNEKETEFFRCESQLMIHAVDDMVSPAFDAGSSKNHRLEKSNYHSIIWVESTSLGLCYIRPLLHFISVTLPVILSSPESYPSFVFFL